MSEDQRGPGARPDPYDGLSELDKRAAKLFASARFADAGAKNRIHLAVRDAERRRRRTHFPKTLVLVPAGLAFLAALAFLARPSRIIFGRKQGGSKVYVDLASQYYSAEDIHAALRGS